MPKKKRSIGKQTKRILQEEIKIESLEKKQLQELEDLERLEKEIRANTAPHPLKKITYRDVSKAFIGALFGAVAHYAFLKGADIAEQITMARATWLLIFSFFMGSVFIYLTGFRQVKQIRIANLIPVRIFVIYFTALLTVVVMLFIFNLTDLSSFESVYKQVSAVSILAILGASTADLIGKSE